MVFCIYECRYIVVSAAFGLSELSTCLWPMKKAFFSFYIIKNNKWRKTNDSRSSAFFKELGWVNLTEKWTFHKCETVYRCLNYFCPSYLSNLFCLNSEVHNHNTRRKNDIHLIEIESKSGERSFTYKAAKLFHHQVCKICNNVYKPLLAW